MSGQTVALKKIGDVQITVTPEGKFCATVGGRILTRRSLKELERQIDKYGSGLDVMFLTNTRPFGGWSGPRVQRSQVVGIEADGRYRLVNGQLEYPRDPTGPFIYDREIEAEWNTLIHELESYTADWEKRLKAVIAKTRKPTRDDIGGAQTRV